ncbi:MAG: hypothetical protein JXQ29_16955 [Planctomycetes bacterium]|nr:hypothetical protein [Planctomycetota bacterium]
MTARIALFLFPLLVAGLAVAALEAQLEGAATSQDFTRAVTAADAVVVGRVIDMVDRNVPPAELERRKIREAHRVDVVTTLKGHDIAQRRIVVRPNTLVWEDGDEYVLFLLDRGNGFFDAIPEPVLTESPAGIAALVQKLGFKALPRLELRMRSFGGCCSTHSGLLQDLRIAADGCFELEAVVMGADGHPGSTWDVARGVLPKDAIAQLRAQVAAVAKKPLPDGGGLLNFELSSAPGKVDYLTFSRLDRPEVEALLAGAAALARAHAGESVRVDRAVEK